ncbi:hypothetical protein F5X99DRAFT_421857 [Biscogniauxia marginata]|nr:hypothetical protein F5X99DRAFT_421857 [Biscogniauxia marginata]
MGTGDGGRIGQALVDFSLYGIFPEEDISSRQLAVGDFALALESLAEAKTKLEADIHQVNEDTAPDVNQWVAHAKSLEDDVNRTRNWANEIVRRSEAPDVLGRAIEEAEEKVEFLRQEATYNQQVYHALQSIKCVNELLDQVEQARDERRILDSLRLLEKSWIALDEIPVSKSCRVMKLLDMRAFELKSAVHDVFDHVWNSLVQVDAEAAKVTVFENREDEQMNLVDAVIGLKAYKEVDQRMAILWHSLDDALIGPRTSPENQELSAVRAEDVSFEFPTPSFWNIQLKALQSSLHLSGKADRTIASLFSDLQLIMTYLSNRLPEELVYALSNVMMPDLIPRIISSWLDYAVPASLQEIDEFQQVIDASRNFCGILEALKFSGFEELQEWVRNAPRVWLAKCRERALDLVRTKLAQGLGEAKEIERVETQIISTSEDPGLAANGVASSARDDTNPASNEDDGTDAWGWGDDDANEVPETTHEPQHDEASNEEDPAEAWGWGDEDITDLPLEEPASKPEVSQPAAETRELTLKETYRISSMPEPVISLITTILEDGASLLGSEGNPMGSQAAGLFSLPTLVLAMFRAVAPYYYSLEIGGNMFLYNDAAYLSERLSDLSKHWKARDDIVPRAVAMLRLDNDINTLLSFAARAYASEMSTQRTVIRDLLGGSQNLLQQDGLGSSDLESQVDNATGHVRALAATWSGILSKSAWSQAVGSLVDTIASKLISDVMDLAGIGQDEAYNIANLIVRVTELDDLFLPPDAGKDAIPTTAEYAGSWLRLKYLSEVLQSNLQDVKYLWMESELSLYFTVDEVVDLIGLSFVDNARTRDVVREIQGKPNPLGQ